MSWTPSLDFSGSVGTSDLERVQICGPGNYAATIPAGQQQSGPRQLQGALESSAPSDLKQSLGVVRPSSLLGPYDEPRLTDKFIISASK